MRQVYQLMPGVEGSMDMYYSGNDQDYRCVGHKGTKPLMTSFSVYNLARNNCFDSTKAMRELCYRTRSYRETMHDEIQWLIQTGKVKAPAVKSAVMEPVPAHA